MMDDDLVDLVAVDSGNVNFQYGFQDLFNVHFRVDLDLWWYFDEGNDPFAAHCPDDHELLS